MVVPDKEKVKKMIKLNGQKISTRKFKILFGESAIFLVPDPQPLKAAVSV